MEQAKLNYLISTDLVEYFFKKNIYDKIYKTLSNNTINTANLELVKDILFNRTFRGDIYIKGSRLKLTAYDKEEWFLNTKWIVWNKNKFPKNHTLSYFFGTLKLDPVIYDNILNIINNKPLLGKDILKKVKISNNTLIQALTILYTCNVAAVYNEKKTLAINLNRVLLQNRFIPDFFNKIIAPNISNVIKVSNRHWIASFYDDNKEQNIVDKVYNYYVQRKLTININNKPLNNKELKIYLKKLYNKWKQEEYPIIKTLGILPQH